MEKGQAKRQDCINILAHCLGTLCADVSLNQSLKVTAFKNLPPACLHISRGSGFQGKDGFLPRVLGSHEQAEAQPVGVFADIEQAILYSADSCLFQTWPVGCRLQVCERLQEEHTADTGVLYPRGVIAYDSTSSSCYHMTVPENTKNSMPAPNQHKGTYQTIFGRFDEHDHTNFGIACTQQ